MRSPKSRFVPLISALAIIAGLAACKASAPPADHQPPNAAQTSEFGDTKTILAIPHIRQETMLCVPTSAAMILAFYDDPQPPRLLKALASGATYDPATFNDFTFTYYRDLVRAVQTLGYSWMERSYPNTDRGFSDGLALIESEIRNGRPVMVDVSEPEGHTFVIGGFDTDARKLFIVDPNREAPGQRWVTYDELQAMWNEHAWGGDFRSLVTTRPKGDG